MSGQLCPLPGSIEMAEKKALRAYIVVKNPSEGLDIANMVRGLANGVGGFCSIAGQTNQRYLKHQYLRFVFCDERSRSKFKRKADRWFGPKVVVKRLTPRKNSR